MICKVFICITVLCLSLYTDIAKGCRAEVCRRRRATVVQSDVLLQLHGCSGQTKPWVRQIAYCLNKSTIDVALSMKEWYVRTYSICTENGECDAVRKGTNNIPDIFNCVDCFTRKLPNQGFLKNQNVNISKVTKCVNQYVQASLTTELPVFTAETNSRGKVTLPSLRPQNQWWALTVQLPCKPPLFRFWNANCINSFADDTRARDFVLTHNELVYSNDITFLATFSDTCRFNINEVKIIWSKSIPGFAAPQLSSFPTAFPPKKSESGNIFFNEVAYERLQRTDGGKPPRQIKSRQKRQIDENIATSLGIVMPCKIGGFSVSNNNGNIPVKSSGTRYLIESPEHLLKIGKPLSFRSLNFTLDFDYEKTKCVFSSNEPEIVVNPPPGWLDPEKPAKKSIVRGPIVTRPTSRPKVTCYTCNNAASDEECKKKVKCHNGQICMSEVRQITQNKVSITKACKYAQACRTNQFQNMYQCKPGHQSSVCRCCCNNHNNCNTDSYKCT